MRYRLNYNGQQVSEPFTRLAAAREFLARHTDTAGIWIEKEDPDTGDWFPVDRVKRNPELAIVSLGMNPPGRRSRKPEPYPDTHTLNRAYRGYLMRGTMFDGVHLSKDGFHVGTVRDEAHAMATVDLLHGDASPPPNVAGNPSGEVFGSDVLAIIYQHEDDRAGTVRVHTFGGQREAKWRETRSGRGVEVYDFPSATGVYMSAEGDKRVVMQHRRGLPLVQEF